MTARAAAIGRRAHQRWSVEGWPCRIDFSRAAATLMASSGRATSIIIFGRRNDTEFISEVPRCTVELRCNMGSHQLLAGHGPDIASILQYPTRVMNQSRASTA